MLLARASLLECELKESRIYSILFIAVSLALNKLLVQRPQTCVDIPQISEDALSVNKSINKSNRHEVMKILKPWPILGPVKAKS